MDHHSSRFVRALIWALFVLALLIVAGRHTSGAVMSPRERATETTEPGAPRNHASPDDGTLDLS